MSPTGRDLLLLQPNRAAMYNYNVSQRIAVAPVGAKPEQLYICFRSKGTPLISAYRLLE